MGITVGEAILLEPFLENDIQPQVVALESKLKELGVNGDAREELGVMVGDLSLCYFRIGLGTYLSSCKS